MIMLPLFSDFDFSYKQCAQPFCDRHPHWVGSINGIKTGPKVNQKHCSITLTVSPLSIYQYLYETLVINTKVHVKVVINSTQFLIIFFW